MEQRMKRLPGNEEYLFPARRRPFLRIPGRGGAGLTPGNDRREESGE